ncbi:hypothetical protein DYB32_003293 [Aphanomyces invadans]|uniref:TOG domain-containing protein n=1 Tax=Aphanomyces invadans TaxID=157072 RepID=A0A418B1E3_9STRA|nr:hypothetical protein DYB32_003293 [Aphanomyces invadans]
MGGGGGEIESYVQDFMVIQHDPLEEERNLQRQTERLLDRWHGLVLKGPENAVDLNSVEARIQRNIDRHEKMLAWLGSMERNLYEDTIAYEDACAMSSCGEQDDELRSYPNVVDESEPDCGNLSLVKWMVSNGADIDTDYSRKVTTNDDDRRYDLAFTPLQVACVKGHHEIVDFLVECNADLGGSALYGVTALHFACHQVLLDAGADMHAADAAGASAMDIASGDTLAFLTAYDANGGGGASTGDEDDGPRSPFDQDRRRPSTTAIDGPDMARLVPDCIGKAFGADVARSLASHEWKARQQAVTEVGLVMAQHAGAARLFDAACHVVVVAIKDSVGQVCAAAMPLVKAAFNSVLSSSTFHTPGYHTSHPLIGTILDALLARAAGSHERDASDAVTSLLFLACKSAHATQHMVRTMQGQLGGPSTSSAMTAAGWRQQLVNIRLLTAMASQYRFAAESGLSFADAMAVSSQALDHSSVKVRSAAVDLVVQAIVVASEQSGTHDRLFVLNDLTIACGAGLPGTAADGVADQVVEYADSLVHQYLGSHVKASIVANIHKSLRGALGNSKRLSRGAITPGKASEVHEPLVHAKPRNPPQADDWSDADLPYAEPVQGSRCSQLGRANNDAEQCKAQADGISAAFGDKVARCLFSNAWAPRVEGLSYLQKLLQAKRCDMSAATIAALDTVLQAAVSDRVNAYEAGLSLLMEFVLAYGGSAASNSAKPLQDCLRPVVSRLVLKLGDSKQRLQVVSEDALLFMARQPLVGPAFVLDAMPSVPAPSSSLLANKLNVVGKLLLEFGVHECGGGGVLGLKHALQPALAACEHKDAAVRQASIQIFSEAFKVRTATMPFLSGLARGAKQKLIAKLVELGVLESDLLMDEVDDFDSVPRPSTSGPRPPTASGSSTKHRPSLANVSVLAPPATAAVREIEKQVVLAGSAACNNGPPRWPTDAATLVVLSEALELVLHDTVARVYQCALRLLQVIATDFVPSVPGHGHVLDSILKPAVEAVIQKLGDSKPRVRSDSFAVLHAVATLPHVGPAAVAAIVMDQFDATDAPVAKTEMLMLLTSLLRESKPTKGTDSDGKGRVAPPSVDHKTGGAAVHLATVLDTIVPALDNKHVDIRNAAVAAYTALYEVVKATPTSTLDLERCLAHVKPAVREAISKNIVQLANSSAAMPPPLTLDDNNDASPEVESARSESHDLEKVAAVFGAEMAARLAHPAKRRHGLVQLIGKLTATAPTQDKSSGTAAPWEVCCLMAKTMLVDASVAVVLTTFQLLTAVVSGATSASQGDRASLIPWGEWGVHLVLASTVRSVLQQAAHPAVRVRLAVKQWLQVLAHRHTLGRTVVATALVGPPDAVRQPGVSGGSCSRAKRLQHVRLGWQLVVRLEMLDDMLQDDPSTDFVDNVLPFLGASCIGHGSAAVREWTRTILMWFHSQDAPRLTTALQRGSIPHGRQLAALLADATAAVSTADGPPSTVHVRTSRMSHVRRVAALRGGPGDESPRDDDSPALASDNAPVVSRSTTKSNQVHGIATKPLWLRDQREDQLEHGGGQLGLARGPNLMGGASGLVKARRTSRRRNNHDDDDEDDDDRHGTPQCRRVHVGNA